MPVFDLDRLDALTVTVRAEFHEMPGLQLTRAQARRLWHLDAVVCERLTARLIADGFLLENARGQLVAAASVTR